MALVYLYFVELLIRPQDWNPLLLGLPTHWLIVVPGFVYALLRSSNKSSVLRTPESRFLLLYTCYIFITTLINEGYWDGRIQFTKSLQVASIFYLLYLLLDEERKIRKTMLFVLILGALLGEHALQQAWTGVGWAGVTLDPKYADIRVRWLGIWDGSNGLALLFGTLLPLGFEFFLGGKRKLLRVAGLLCVILLSIGIFYCNSRGSTLAAICGLSFYAVSRFNRKQVLIVFLLFAALAGSLMPSRMQTVDTKDESGRQRMWAWEQGIRMLRNHPIIGIGKGQFVMNNEQHIQAHNNYVQIFSEGGLIGYFLFMGFFWFPVKRGIVLQWKRGWARQKDLQLLRAGNAACLIFLGGTFFIVVEHDFLTSLFGIMSALTWNQARQEGIQGESITRWDVIGILASMAVIFAAVWVMVIVEPF